jgi:hypothetical protein
MEAPVDGATPGGRLLGALLFTADDANSSSFRWGDTTEVLEACRRFRQGDVVHRASLAFSAHASAPVTSLAQASAAGRVALFGVRTDLEYAMLTSQTCDLRGDRGRKYPLISIAPVYDVATMLPIGQLGNIRLDRVGEFIFLDSPPWAERDGVWVADLRFESSMEKGFLVNQDPIAPFSSEDGYLRCTRKIARVRARAAIDDKILKHLLRPLEALFTGNAVDHRSIIEVLIKATPSTVDARAARIYALLDGPDNRPALQAQFDDWHAQINPTLPHDFTFLGVDVRQASEFTWLDYRGAEIVDFLGLSADL